MKDTFLMFIVSIETNRPFIVAEMSLNSYDFYFRNLTREKFLNEIQNDSKILRLLNFTYSKNI